MTTVDVFIQSFSAALTVGIVVAIIAQSTRRR